MKAITLWQPWASLVAVGVKTIETRSWSTSYRGPLAIHASERKGVYLPDDPERRLWHWSSQTLIEPKFNNEEVWKHGNPFHPAPVGAVVATCTLTDVVPIEAATDALALKPQHRSLVVYGDKLTVFDDLDEGEEVDDQLPFGDFTPGRFAWLLDDIVRLDEPVPARGHQRLWEWAA